MKRTSLARLSALLLALSIAPGLSACGGGAGGVMQTFSALKATAAETASIQVCLDRIEDLDAGLDLVYRLMFKTPVDAEAPWVGKLATLDQPAVASLTQKVKAEEPYNQPGRNVPMLKVLRLHTAALLDENKARKAKYGSVANALAAVAGPSGGDILKGYTELDGLHAQVGVLKGKLAALDVEEDAETTTPERKAAIPAEKEALEKAVEAQELAIGPAEDKLIAAVDALGQLKPTPEQLPLTLAIFKVTQRAADLEIESGLLAATTSIQTVTAIPRLPMELQALAQRWLSEAVSELGGQAKDALNLTPKIEIGLEGISLGLEGPGLGALDVGKVKDTLFGKVKKFYGQATAAPGAVSAVKEKVGFQARFLTSLGTSLASMAGAQFQAALPLTVPNE